MCCAQSPAYEKLLLPSSMTRLSLRNCTEKSEPQNALAPRPQWRWTCQTIARTLGMCNDSRSDVGLRPRRPPRPFAFDRTMGLIGSLSAPTWLADCIRNSNLDVLSKLGQVSYHPPCRKTAQL
jgi:hypothetical protein